MEYRNVSITMWEGNEYVKDGLEVASFDGKFFYVAESKYGRSFANQPQKALEGAQEQIDKAVSK